MPALGFSVWSVSGTSMEPTFRDGSILVLRSSSSSVARGDVVVIDRPSSWHVVQTSVTSSVKNDGTGDESRKSIGSRFGRSALLKRVLAAPGDTLSFDGKAFLVNGDVCIVLLTTTTNAALCLLDGHTSCLLMSCS